MFPRKTQMYLFWRAVDDRKESERLSIASVMPRLKWGVPLFSCTLPRQRETSCNSASRADNVRNHVVVDVNADRTAVPLVSSEEDWALTLAV
ncbi:hypothetical protein BaRGS_00011365 [Batillaria attramentaria]|uniref:Uncharacterized protein n=1 Tax=Batillaria attramentaria TaxID=370345 RepID=A0ABD0LCU9_9CAEN